MTSALFDGTGRGSPLTLMLYLHFRALTSFDGHLIGEH
jgi:hypothetical protein